MCEEADLESQKKSQPEPESQKMKGAPDATAEDGELSEARTDTEAEAKNVLSGTRELLLLLEDYYAIPAIVEGGVKEEEAKQILAKRTLLVALLNSEKEGALTVELEQETFEKFIDPLFKYRKADREGGSPFVKYIEEPFRLLSAYAKRYENPDAKFIAKWSAAIGLGIQRYFEGFDENADKSFFSLKDLITVSDIAKEAHELSHLDNKADIDKNAKIVVFHVMDALFNEFMSDVSSMHYQNSAIIEYFTLIRERAADFDLEIPIEKLEGYLTEKAEEFTELVTLIEGAAFTDDYKSSKNEQKGEKRAFELRLKRANLLPQLKIKIMKDQYDTADDFIADMGARWEATKTTNTEWRHDQACKKARRILSEIESKTQTEEVLWPHEIMEELIEATEIIAATGDTPDDLQRKAIGARLTEGGREHAIYNYNREAERLIVLIGSKEKKIECDFLVRMKGPPPGVSSDMLDDITVIRHRKLVVIKIYEATLKQLHNITAKGESINDIKNIETMSAIVERLQSVLYLCYGFLTTSNDREELQKEADELVLKVCEVGEEE